MAIHEQLMLFIHVTSVIIWFSSIPIYIVIERIIRSENNISSILSVLNPVGIGVMLAQFLVLITGAGLAGSNWFQFQETAWLAIKQIVFILLLGFSHGVILKNNREILNLAENGSDTGELLDTFSKNVKLSYVSGFLILLNVFLATTKII